MKVWSRIATWSLVGLITANVAGAACYIVLQKQLLRSRRPQPSLAVGEQFPAFSGVDVRGARWESKNPPCRVIRIADDSCAYCKKDKPSYEKFVDAARRASCEVVEMSPRAGGMADNPRPGIVQLKYVDADVGAPLFPFVTPQTIILDRDWSVKWTRRGIFDDKSLAASISLLGTLGKK